MQILGFLTFPLMPLVYRAFEHQNSATRIMASGGVMILATCLLGMNLAAKEPTVLKVRSAKVGEISA
jgi:hypothetical protein